ncbi:hypothetical protein NDN08_006957 [Rhodosorus marinus]|uniref:tRNA pseudouridine synthase n=1 Tax=Rhodosorus marinus TaxID=101924 RepID=A0AAV8UJ75_9RHOD|nr:hypothetical protein NDN08_006957 [Rhodosorus marinus]
MLSRGELAALSKNELVERAIELQTQLAEVQRSVPAPNSREEKERHSERKRKGRSIAFEAKRLIALKVAYIGWMFHGFQIQKSKEDTVEGRLFEALKRTQLIEESASMSDVDWSRGGRTDVGVSAIGNVVGVRVRCKQNVEMDYAKILNGVLPDGLRVLSWGPAVEAGVMVAGRRRMRENQCFDARNDALSRTYKYLFFKKNLDIGLMREGAKAFIGQHDYRNYCKIDVNDTKASYVRVILDVQINPVKSSRLCLDQNLFEIVVKGYAFLWHQIRCMAAVLFRVGSRLEPPSIVERLLRVGDGAEFSGGKPTYRLASEIPLILYDCEYPPGIAPFCDYQAPGGMVSKRMDDPFMDTWLRYAMRAAVTSSFIREVDAIPIEGGALWADERNSSEPLILDKDPEKLALPKRRREGTIDKKQELHRRKLDRKNKAKSASM